MATLKRRVHVRVVERSEIGAARRRTSELASRAGLDDADVGRLALVVTELATNLVEHAGGGDVFARVADAGGRRAIEVLVVDRGPGIAEVDRALQDGFSTASTAGTGLGAARRMADRLDLHSLPGEGTVVSAVVAPGTNGDGAELPSPAVGALERPHLHEEVAGDDWAVRCEGHRTAVAVVDGLGHGPRAGEAAAEAVRSFMSGPWRGTEAAIESMHGAIRHTRGAVGGVLEIDRASETIRFTGVGNVGACVLHPGGKRSLVSRNGTLGRQVRKLREYVHPLEPAAVAVLHTDGIRTRWKEEEVRGMLRRPPSLLCGVLYLFHYRGRDDATVVALRPDLLPAHESGENP